MNRLSIFQAFALTLTSTAFALFAVSPTIRAQDEKRYVYPDEPTVLRHLWQSDPELSGNWLVRQNLAINLVVLPRLASETKRGYILKQAQKVSINAEQFGSNDEEKVLETVFEQLAKGQENRQVRLALVSAAVNLCQSEARQKLYAQKLWELAKNDAVTRLLVERACVDWKNSLPLDLWRARTQKLEAPTVELLTAVEGLGNAGESQDTSALLPIVTRERLGVPLRLAAAKSLGALSADGLEDLANDLIESSNHGELLAAHVLSNHTSESAFKTLTAILSSKHRPAKLVAFRSMCDHWPSKARTFTGQLKTYPEANMRRLLIGLQAKFEDGESVALLGEFLSDSTEVNRVEARQLLEQKSTVETLRADVDQLLDRTLTGGNALAIEQGVQLAVALNAAARCESFLDLLEHPESQASNAAAWGLQELAEAKEVLERIEVKASSMTDEHFAGNEMSVAECVRVGFLLEALGKNEVQSASPLFARYIPEYCANKVARAAAIWALGKIKAGTKDEGLANKLAERMLDVDPGSPEDDLVRYSCAVALARIGHPSSAGKLREVEVKPPYPLGLACDWAIQQLEGP